MKEIIKEECPSCDVHDYCSIHNPEPLENKEEQYKEHHKGKTTACLCSDCIEYANHLFDTAHSTPQTPEWEEEFDKTFVREDGLMDKYYDDKFMAEAIKSFISKKLSQAEERGRRRVIEEIKNLIK